MMSESRFSRNLKIENIYEKDGNIKESLNIETNHSANFIVKDYLIIEENNYNKNDMLIDKKYSYDNKLIKEIINRIETNEITAKSKYSYQGNIQTIKHYDKNGDLLLTIIKVAEEGKL